MKPPQTTPYRVVLAACALLVILCCATMGYYSIFTNLQHQDDEGQLIQSVRNFLVGQPMY
jgi:hypothetical protein